jgi:hypothetical protein
MSSYFEFGGFVAPAIALFTFKKISDKEKENLDLTNYFNNFKALLIAAREEKQKIAIIVDATECNWISMGILSKKIEFIKELHAENLVSNILTGSAIIIENKFFSWVLEYIFKVVKPQSPANSFLNIPDAITWLQSQFL